MGEISFVSMRISEDLEPLVYTDKGSGGSSSSFPLIKELIETLNKYGLCFEKEDNNYVAISSAKKIYMTIRYNANNASAFSPITECDGIHVCVLVCKATDGYRTLIKKFDDLNDVYQKDTGGNIDKSNKSINIDKISLSKECFGNDVLAENEIIENMVQQIKTIVVGSN